jgi:hypothetical protein
LARASDDTITVELDNRLEELFGDDSEDGGDDFDDASVADDVSVVDDADGSFDDLFAEEDESSAKTASADAGEEDVLEELFEEEPEKSPPVEMEPEDNLANQPIRDLKSIIMSIDWEISDDIMNRLRNEIKKLNKTYQNDKIVLTFLKLLESLGRYIEKNKAKAHPDSLNLLSSVYKNLEKVVVSEKLSTAEKKKIVTIEFNKFKELKEQIAKAPADKVDKPVNKKVVEPEKPPEPVKKVVAKEKEPAPAAKQPAPKTAAPKKAVPTPEEKAQPIPADTDQMAPHEAFALALEEIKKTIQAEFSALRAELEMWRKGR